MDSGRRGVWSWGLPTGLMMKETEKDEAASEQIQAQQLRLQPELPSDLTKGFAVPRINGARVH